MDLELVQVKLRQLRIRLHQRKINQLQRMYLHLSRLSQVDDGSTPSLSLHPIAIVYLSLCLKFLVEAPINTVPGFDDIGKLPTPSPAAADNNWMDMLGPDTGVETRCI